MQACRACLSLVSNDKPVYYLNDIYVNPGQSSSTPNTITIREKLGDCVPELLLDSLHDAVLCEPCVNNLMMAYAFRQRCLETQNKIYGYVQQILSNSKIDVKDIAIYYNQLKIVAEGDNPLVNENNLKSSPTTLVTFKQESDFECNNTPSISVQVCKKEEPTDMVDVISDSEHESSNAAKIPDFECNNTPSIPVQVCKTEEHTDMIDVIYDSEDESSNAAKIPERNQEILKSFSCKICNMVFYEEVDLRDHIVVTHQNPLLYCNECRFSTRMPFIMRKHKKTHKKKKQLQFKCPDCPYAAKKNLSLKSHMQDKHKGGRNKH